MRNEIVDREAWNKARAELLQKEKAHTRARQALAEERRALPWVKVDREYRFRDAEGEHAFVDLFRGRSQLLIYHLMFGPGWDAPCIGCTQWANALNGTTGTFRKANARLIAVSRAPVEEIESQQQALNWNFGWYSVHGSDFNLDFHFSSDDLSVGHSVITDEESDQRVEFDRGENHGVSVFYRTDDNEIFHTYSAYNRGIEALNGAFGYYDLLPEGRAW